MLLYPKALFSTLKETKERLSVHSICPEAFLGSQDSEQDGMECRNDIALALKQGKKIYRRVIFFEK